MEESSGVYGTTGPIPSGHEEFLQWTDQPLLGDTGMLHGDQGKLSGMGISGGASLLVYQRDHLSWRGARELARKDEDVPTMQSVSIHVALP
jgi:hypothetical protein